ncbi:hypothetical protein PoB_001668900 [Plakobranchus ocellatus]|uniref:Uncharacterized protein n=1 Tax=Plakobranchus ocellatus TaxID=259542 RepID=A0AAV3Z723_9GAST|nr:hypothetical protein PoB_001668900 [Plakobranchus ocellatus]
MDGITLVVLKLFVGMMGAQLLISSSQAIKPKPTVTIVTNSSSYLCSEQFLVVNEDVVTFELDLSNNNSEYTYAEFEWPRFRLHVFVTKNGTTSKRFDSLVEGEDYTILELDVSGNSSRYSFRKDRWPRFEYKTRRNGMLNKAIIFCTPFAIPQNGFCVTKLSFPNGCSCEPIRKDTFRLRANFTPSSKEMSHGQISLTWPGKYGPVRYDYDLPEVKKRPTEPEIKVFQIKPIVNCALDYQVVGEDYTLLDLDVSGNSSRYSFEKDLWPRFEYKTRRNGMLSKTMLFCTPFTIPQNGFCVAKDSFPNACSCEKVGKDTFRLRANFSLRSQEISKGQISLTWPGKFGPVRYEYALPEVKMKPKQCRKYFCDGLSFDLRGKKKSRWEGWVRGRIIHFGKDTDVYDI